MVYYNYMPGVQTSDDMAMARKDYIVQDIDTRVLQFMDFLPAVQTQETVSRHVNLRFPKEDLPAVYEVGEGEAAESQHIGYYDDSMTLDKFKVTLAITDEAKSDGDVGLQWEQAKSMAAQSMANKRDSEILNALQTHAGVTEDAATTWDGTGANVIGDIADTMKQVFAATLTNISASEIANLKIFYPAKLFMYVQNKPELWLNSGTSAGNQGYLIPNSTQTEWLGGRGIQFVPTSRLNASTYALGVMSGPKTATQYHYSGTAIPQVEWFRDQQRGEEGYQITSLFKTYVNPQSVHQKTTNNRVFKITGVTA